MKRTVATLVVVTLVFAVCFAAAAAAQSTALADVVAENAVKQLERQWEQALIRGDQAAIDRIVAEDCLFVGSTGELMTKAQADADRRNTLLRASTITQMNVRIFGDVAIVIGTNLETSQYAGQDTSGQYRWTDVFARRTGEWKVVSAQSTRIDENAIAANGTLPTIPNVAAVATTSPIDGLSEAEVLQKLGRPSLIQGEGNVTIWYYDKGQSTTKVYFYRGKASSERPR